MPDGLLLTLMAVVGGAIGGLANALITDKGFKGWYIDRPEPGERRGVVFYPGALGNVVIGVVGALVTWGFTSTGVKEYADTAAVSVLATSVLVGVGGAKALTGEAERRLGQATAQNLADAGVIPSEVVPPEDGDDT